MTVNNFGCVGNTIRLRSGHYLDLRRPQPDQFTFADIAGALSKICRFGGQCERFYSVAEHSYHCARVSLTDGLTIREQRAVLMHDAAEAFIGDIVKPLKIMLPDYAEIETLMEDCILNKFDLDCDPNLIREIDHAMLICERKRMFSRDAEKWAGEDSVRNISVEFKCWFPFEAEKMFCVRARELGFLNDNPIIDTKKYGAE